MTNYIIGEHYYTTSKFKNGLHTLDHSKFLNTDEVDALEKSGVYKTASELNHNPTEQEIKNEFPINTAFYRLPTSGRFVYLRSQYTGTANHTPDRHGNFFSHSVILKDNQPSVPAALLFNQFESSFRKGFSIEEDESFKPELSEREIVIDDQNVTAYIPAFTRFCDFLQIENNLKIFSKILDLIVDGTLTTKGNIITICAEKNQVRETILAINFFLPQHIANKISFATYVNNPTRYPFQIAGIIPQCGITTLDTRYYSLVEATPNFEYDIKHAYTKFLSDVIKEKSDNSFEQWKDLNNEIKSLGINEPNLQLNAPILFRNFVKEIFLKDIQDFKNLLNLNLPTEKVNELKKVTVEKNPELYLKYVLGELKNAKSRASWFNEKKEAYLKIYLEHFENNNSFREDYLPYLVEEFREGLSATERSLASLHVLSTSNTNGIKASNWLNERFQEADLWFEDEFIDIEKKLDPVRILNDKYKLQTFQETIPNIMKVKSFDDIRKAAEKDDFVRNIRNYKDFLSKATDKEKTELLLLGFNHDAYFFKMKFQDFDNYIKVVKEYLPEQQPDFWYRFFDNNSRGFNKDNNPKKHSLDYLKKKFVSLLFLKQNENHELFSKLKLDDEYTIRWIEEDIREHTTREAVLETFAEAFKNYTSIRNSSFWNFFGKK